MKNFLIELILWPYRLYAVFMAIASMVVFGFWGFLLTLLDSSGDWVMKYAAGPWGRFLLGCIGLRIKIEGLENLDPDGTYIFMPNHASFVDVPIIVSRIPYNMRTIAKGLFFHIPFFGSAMTRSRNIKMYRDNPRKDLKKLDEAATLLKEGISIVVFPEGTRTRDGKLQQLKNALFILPVRTGFPVVPVAIKGTYEVLPSDSVRLKPGPVTISFLPPIDSTQYTQKDRTQYADDVFQVLQTELEDPPAA